MKGPRLKLQLLIFTILCGLVLVLAFIPSSFFRYPYISSLFMNAMHFPAGIMLIFVGHILLRPLLSNTLITGLCCLLFAVIELIQPFFGRDASMGDFLISLLGVLIGWLWLYSKKKNQQGRQLWLAFVAMLLFAIVLMPGMQALHKAKKINDLFPVIANFETSGQAFIYDNWKPNISLVTHNKIIENNSKFLHVEKGDIRWWGTTIKIIAQDWQDFNQLCFYAKADADGRQLLIRFDDQLTRGHASSSTRVQAINEYWTIYCINLRELKTRDKRDIDLSQMKQLIIFMDAKKSGEHFSIDEIQLKQ